MKIKADGSQLSTLNTCLQVKSCHLIKQLHLDHFMSFVFLIKTCKKQVMFLAPSVGLSSLCIHYYFIIFVLVCLGLSWDF